MPDFVQDQWGRVWAGCLPPNLQPPEDNRAPEAPPPARAREESQAQGGQIGLFEESPPIAPEPGRVPRGTWTHAKCGWEGPAPELLPVAEGWKCPRCGDPAWDMCSRDERPVKRRGERPRERTFADEHYLVLELGGHQQGRTTAYGRSWLEAIEWECGYTPSGLERMREDEAQDKGWGPEDEAHVASLREAAKRARPSRPPLHGPILDPTLHNAGYHLADLGARARALLSDGQWHSYSDVASLFAMDSHPGRNDFYAVLTWGDDPSLRDWQVAVCVTGRMDESGRFALWDSAVARAHRAQYDSSLQRERRTVEECERGMALGLPACNEPWVFSDAGIRGGWTLPTTPEERRCSAHSLTTSTAQEPLLPRVPPPSDTSDGRGAETGHHKPDELEGPRVAVAPEAPCPCLEGHAAPPLSFEALVSACAGVQLDLDSERLQERQEGTLRELRQAQDEMREMGPAEMDSDFQVGQMNPGLRAELMAAATRVRAALAKGKLSQPEMLKVVGVDAKGLTLLYRVTQSPAFIRPLLPWQVLVLIHGDGKGGCWYTAAA